MQSDDLNREIDVAELRTFLNAVLRHTENDLGIKKVEVDDNHNFFWEVPLDDLFNVADTEPKLVMGSVVDSLEFVSKAISRGSTQSDAATLMLMHVIPLLQVICHKVRA